MEDDDTELTPAPVSDTCGVLVAVPQVGEADTDREVAAQGPNEVLPVMLEDTGVMIVERPASNEEFVISLGGQIDDPAAVNFAESSRIDWEEDATTDAREIPVQSSGPVRAETAGGWPPQPREPAPAIRDRPIRRARAYTIVPRPDTDSKN